MGFQGFVGENVFCTIDAVKGFDSLACTAGIWCGYEYIPVQYFVIVTLARFVVGW
jgi:hypothetical protein